jgi:hypothetical protein
MFASTLNNKNNEEFASVMKRIISRFKKTTPVETTVRPTEISLEEQLSVLARIKAKREAQAFAEMNPLRRTHRDLMNMYKA